MPLNTIIATTVTIGVLGSYAIYKYVSRKKQYDFSLVYTVTEHEKYEVTSFARVYKYNIPSSNSFFDMESSYKLDLMGNYKKKEHVDKVLTEYLQMNTIYQKRLVINTDSWIGDFNVETNVNPNTLVIDIKNNSLVEAKLDA